MIRDLQKNYHDRWNATAIVREAKREYTLLQKKNHLGILIITDEAIGSFEQGKKFALAIPQVGIMSTNQLMKRSLEKPEMETVGYERTLKIASFTIAGILGLPPSTVPQCPLSMAENLFILDTQQANFCENSKQSLRELYQTLPK